MLPAWEQSYLREIVFGNAPQVSFASAGFGEFNGRALPYRSGSERSNSYGGSSSSQSLYTPISASSSTNMSGGLSSPASKSISYGIAGLHTESNTVNAFYGEGSGSNKRPHIEMSKESSQGSQGTFQASQPTSQNQNPPPRQPNLLPQLNQIPGATTPQPFRAPQQQNPVPGAAAPQVPQQPQFSSNQGPSFQAEPTQPQQTIPITIEEDRRVRKGKRRVGRKIEPQPLTKLINKSGSYNNPISVREILKNNKIDVTIINLIAWSLAIYKELKRLVTRVSKKRIPKPKQPDQIQQFRPTFPQQVPQPMPMAFQPMQSVPTAFMPAPFSVSGQVPQPPQPLQAGQVSLAQSYSIEAERHTRFLSAIIGADKA